MDDSIGWSLKFRAPVWLTISARFSCDAFLEDGTEMGCAPP